MDGNEALTVEVRKLEDRVDREGKINAKQHDEMNERLDKIIDEALKRWPQGVAIAFGFLTGLCSALATWAFTHPVK